MLSTCPSSSGGERRPTRHRSRRAPPSRRSRLNAKDVGLTMALTILEVLRSEPPGVRARVRHNDSDFVALLVGDRDQTSGAEILFEMDYGSIASARPLPEFVDQSSGIWQGQGDAIIVRGRVHQVHGDPRDTLIDLYLMNGPEFFLFRLSDTTLDAPGVGVGLELVVSGLRILL
jgi:hypothetical protein